MVTKFWERDKDFAPLASRTISAIYQANSALRYFRKRVARDTSRTSASLANSTVVIDFS
jgi:hypothetical protein